MENRAIRNATIFFTAGLHAARGDSRGLISKNKFKNYAILEKPAMR
jgi:hypothetical protein